MRFNSKEAMRGRKSWFPALVVAGCLLIAAVTLSPAGQVRYVYDDYGRVTRVEYPDGKVIQYTYDPAGNVTRVERTLDPALADPDDDGVVADVDNCPGIYNPGQEDCDLDGTGDACDPDRVDPDGDLIDAACDNCPSTANTWQLDADTDGVGDVCDLCTDIDGDGFGDPGFPANTCPSDNCPEIFNDLQEDADGDGLGDLCDPTPEPDDCLDVLPGTVAWLPAEDDPGDISYDLIGSYHGTVVAPAAHGAGLVGGSFEFTGGDVGRVMIPAEALDGLGDFTIEFWLKTIAPAAGTADTLISGAASNSGSNELLMMATPEGLHIYINGMLWGSGIYTWGTGGWRHVALTREGGIGWLYVDGARRSSHGAVPTRPLSITAGGLLLGQDQDCVGGCFDANQALVGEIDELAVYDRALSWGEVQTIYWAGANGKCEDQSPDTDQDGVMDHLDNCPTVHNPGVGQTDSDFDGQGDVCDPCPFDPNDDAIAGTGPCVAEAGWRLTETIDTFVSLQAGRFDPNYNPSDPSSFRFYAVNHGSTGVDGVYRVRTDGTSQMVGTEFHMVSDLMMDPDPATGRVFASTDANHRVARWNGTVWETILYPVGTPAGMAIVPADYPGLVVQPGDALVAEYGSDRILKWLPDGAEGQTAEVVYPPSGTATSLVAPLDVAVSDSRIWITDTGGGSDGAIYELTAERSLARLDTSESIAEPASLVIDPASDDLLVLDSQANSGGRRVVRIDPATGTVSNLVTTLTQPSWWGLDLSPGGDQLLISEYTQGKLQLFTLDSDGDGVIESADNCPSTFNFAQEDSEIPAANVSNWSFDEGSGTVAADSVGSNDGTIYGATHATGVSGSGIHMTGSVSDYVNVTSVTAFPTTEITLSYHVKTDVSYNSGSVFSYATAGGTYNDFLVFDWAGGGVWVYVNGAGVLTGVKYNDKQWHQIVVTWRSVDGRLQLHKDGELAYEGYVAAGYSFASGGVLIMGQDQDVLGGGFQTGQAFSGTLDEVRVFDRVLDPSELPDGVGDVCDNCPGVANRDQADFDGDALGDACDDDDDDDGTPDAVDCDDHNRWCTTDCTDADQDGYCALQDCDEAEASCNIDCATDVDGDLTPDCRDTCIDADGDGFGGAGGTGHTCVSDCDDTLATCTTDCSSDVDGDALRDCADGCIDADGDGYGVGGGAAYSCAGVDCNDAAAGCTTDCAADADGDTYPDCMDVCPAIANPDQADHDADGIGDVCDPCTDLDGDGLGDRGFLNPGCAVGPEDNCPNDADNDVDEDGICADVDTCPGRWDPLQEDSDGDGRGDRCDVCPFDAEDDPDGDGSVGPCIVESGWYLSDAVTFTNPIAAHFNPLDPVHPIYVCRLDTGFYKVDLAGNETALWTGDHCTGVVVDPIDGDAFASESWDGYIFRTAYGAIEKVTWVNGFHADDDDPTGMAIAPQGYAGPVLSPGEALVVDGGYSGLDEVWKWSPEVAQGEVPIHSDDGTLVEARDVAIGTAKVWIVDTGEAGTGAIYEVVDSTGTLRILDTWVTIEGPSAVAVDPTTDQLLVVDARTAGGDGRVLRVDPESGAVSTVFSAFLMTDWVGIDFTPDGDRVVVTDQVKHRIYVFTRDTDGDGLDDSVDKCPALATRDQTDSDGDGVGDACDNCGSLVNPGQADADKDGLGDLCDTCTDSDADGFGDPGFPDNTCPDDNCPYAGNFVQTDTDGDGAGDRCDGCDDWDLDGYGFPGEAPDTCLGTDCDETDPHRNLHDEPEVNDGFDNQCPGDYGYGSVDEISGTSGFNLPGIKDVYLWTMQSGAGMHEVVRSTTPDFSADCFWHLDITFEGLWIDGELPAAGSCFYYMVRALDPHLGSWGADSSGTERAVTCP